MKVWIFIILLLIILLAGFLAINLVDKKSTVLDSSSTIHAEVSSCESITNSTSREQCYVYAARDSRDSEICRKISDVKVRGDCYLITDATK